MEYICLNIVWTAECACITYLGKEMAPGCTMGRRHTSDMLYMSKIAIPL